MLLFFATSAQLSLSSEVFLVNIAVTLLIFRNGLYNDGTLRREMGISKRFITEQCRGDVNSTEILQQATEFIKNFYTFQ